MSKGLSTEFVIEVPFYDLDPMNVVWHGNYIKYFEKARCDLLNRFDFGYAEMKAAGYMWPIVDMRIKYINSANFAQKLVCRAEIVEYENRLKIDYLIHCQATGKRLTKGYTIQVAVAIDSMEMQLASPQILLDKLGITND